MKVELTNEDKSHWKVLLQTNPSISRMIEHAMENCPAAFDPLDKLSDSTTVALRSSYSEGWRKSLKFLLEDCAELLPETTKSSFQDMSS